MLNLVNASKTKNSFNLNKLVTYQIFDQTMHVFTTVSTFLLKQYCYWAGFKRKEKGNKPIVFWASYYGENAFYGCRILCWFNVWQGIALLSPAFERNTFITYPYECPFITGSSLASSTWRFQTSYNSCLHNTDNSVQSVMQYVGSLV